MLFRKSKKTTSNNSCEIDTILHWLEQERVGTNTNTKNSVFCFAKLKRGI